MVATVQIPSRFVKLAGEWHGGQSSMLYAVASTGGLTPGTQRPTFPGESRPMGDAEWLIHLWAKLARELQDIASWCGQNPSYEESADYPLILDFLAFTRDTLASLKSAHGLDD